MSASRDTVRGALVRAAVPVYLAVIAGVPAVASVFPVLLADARTSRIIAIFLAPGTFVVAYALTAALLSRVTRRALVPGRFPRSLAHPVYGPRRLHALCWTAVYYCPPVYHAILAVPLLKRVIFRLFGYRGSLDITLYPDTWLRDLPILEISAGAYLSNRATIGTNMCLTSGDVLVAPVRIGERAMVGHLAMLAPGVVLGERVEIGVGAGVGLNVVIGARARVGPCVVVHHGVTIGRRCDIGAASYIGLKTVIGDGLTIPPGTVVPARSLLRTQEDVAAIGVPRVGVHDARSSLREEVFDAVG
jgi:acetyltransferase-like isoleucine patch superfamily enzyme